MGNDQKKLPVGIESFAEIRKEGFYYVDKTSMIRDLIERWGKVNLFTRPRRFGKSLNMSMLQAFFEIGSDPALFEGLEITKDKSLCDEYMGKYPVISISLKNVNGGDYETARSLMCSVIGSEASRFRFLLDSDRISENAKEIYRQLIQVDSEGQGIYTMSDPVLMGSLKSLSAVLEEHYGKQVIILIDEYDVPLAKANEQGYYDRMVMLIRSLFEQALKTNGSLYFAVMTGCLRVAKESIFTGLNNLKMLSITTVRFDEYFGFTDREVQDMLRCYGREDRYEDAREWYDGYRFGNVDVYCPWDVINFCDELIDDPEAEPQDYWSNTSSNDVVRHFIERVDSGLSRGELEELTAGGTVTKEIYEDLTYNRLYESMDHIWSVLFMTGYLTRRGRAEGRRYRLAIPNREIQNIFSRQIMSMFKEKVAEDGMLLNSFCSALKIGDAAEAERLFHVYLSRTISIRDYSVRKPMKESFYQGILLGILGYKDGWYVKSNREAGDGFCDILIRVEKEGIGIIIELKYAEQGQFDAACQNALEQIEANGYASVLREDCPVILKYGIACYKKKCRVMVRTE